MDLTGRVFEPNDPASELRTNTFQVLAQVVETLVQLVVVLDDDADSLSEGRGLAPKLSVLNPEAVFFIREDEILRFEFVQVRVIRSERRRRIVGFLLDGRLILALGVVGQLAEDVVEDR